ncbi:MAG: JAB domain-containing protein [bacterium]|nr:hypothetical protein [Deltaproteobacteria bacterium]MCP4906260.1 JAB domain-containing protein [bacterium]
MAGLEDRSVASGTIESETPPASGPYRSDRPRERLARLGARALSDVELLALVFRTGSRAGDSGVLARAVLARFGGLVDLASAPVVALRSIPGLGPAKAASLVAALELAQRIREEPLERGRPIRSPADVQRHFQPRLMGSKRESFHALLLDGRHRLITEEEVSVGTLTASLVHPREVFREAIRAAAAALLLVHNHPSGNPSPSGEDRRVTERLASAGDLIGIRVVDHVIVCEGSYFSFRESGADCLERSARS